MSRFYYVIQGKQEGIFLLSIFLVCISVKNENHDFYGSHLLSKSKKESLYHVHQFTKMDNIVTRVVRNISRRDVWGLD